MDYLPLPDNTARQVIDSATVFDEFVRVQAQARQYAGGMYWKRQQGYQYLVKTRPDNLQQRIGPRTPETERVFGEFTAHKSAVEARLKSLRGALTDAERLNKALKAGRVPSIVVAVLQAIESTGLGEYFTVVGTHALYAYETAAGVRIVQGALATQDVDLLWDARRRVRFITDIGKLDSSMLKVLQISDPTFQRKQGQNETAINAKGFEVDFLRRQPEGDDPHPFRFSDDEEDLWPVQAKRASVLTNAPRFEHVVISATGRMTLMRTIIPQAFVEFKLWMADKAPRRPEPKRRRDRRQAAIVQTLLDEGLLASST
ncbi:MAG: hypothetical protein HY066_00300 [Betaproteobacteria bacterium]|nr:hypothetical protein [Betaproteobacteria bacterium]